jgi:RimJ/RimL family protein N-acetyltransferase
MLGPTLTGSTVVLAPLMPEHLEHYLLWFADPEVTRYLKHDIPPSRKQEDEWYERTSRSDTDVMWGIFVEGRHVGSISIARINWRSRRAMTGTVIGDKRWWGRGVATDAMRLRTRYAFEELGLEKLVTEVYEGNAASRKALERNGYRTVGVYRHHEFRHGQWFDVWIGEVLREDWLAAQP